MVISCNKTLYFFLFLFLFLVGEADFRSGAKKDGEFCLRYNWLKCLWDILVEILKRQAVLKAAETVGVNDVAHRECLEQWFSNCCTLESLEWGRCLYKRLVSGLHPQTFWFNWSRVQLRVVKSFSSDSNVQWCLGTTGWEIIDTIYLDEKGAENQEGWVGVIWEVGEKWRERCHRSQGRKVKKF